MLSRRILGGLGSSTGLESRQGQDLDSEALQACACQPDRGPGSQQQDCGHGREDCQ